MTLDGTILIITTALTLSLLAALATLADRHARTTAWRQIALERRWNTEHHLSERPQHRSTDKDSGK